MRCRADNLEKMKIAGIVAAVAVMVLLVSLLMPWYTVTSKSR